MTCVQITWRRCYNVSGTNRKLLDEDVTTYQERLAGKLPVEDVTTYQERFASCLTKMLQRIRNILQVTWRRCYNVSGTSCKLLDEDVTTYQERLASYLTKMLQCIRNVLQVAWRRCYNVAGNRYWQRRPQDAPPAKKKNCVQKWQQSRPSMGAITTNSTVSIWICTSTVYFGLDSSNLINPTTNGSNL